MKQTQQRKKRNISGFDLVSNDVISLYFCMMLGFFPVFYKQRYAGMGDAKYKLFLYSTVICVGIVVFIGLIRLFIQNRKKSVTEKYSFYSVGDYIKNLSKTDLAVGIYFICTTLSFLATPFKEVGFYGSNGWNMGYLSQFLFVMVYFILAKVWRYERWPLWLLLGSSFLVYIIGILHRFDIDPLQIYQDLDVTYKVLFLSTMGQSSWYSSFLCTVFPLGLYLFFVSNDKKVRILAGIYSSVAMMTLVTQNSDTAFLSLAAVLFFLYYLSFDEKTNRLYETVILICGSFGFVGFCQAVFADRMIPLDGLSIFLSQSPVVWAVMIVCVVNRIRSEKKKNSSESKREQKRLSIKKDRRLFWILLSLLGVGFVSVIIFIIWNSNGVLLSLFGYQNTNNYLFFDNRWGNGRGGSWKLAVGSFLEMPVLQKLIGVGPDCFSEYIKSVPEYLEQMQALHGDLILTNAHNEYLTKLYNLGFIGVLAYAGMLVVMIQSFVKNRSRNSLLPAFALCAVSYAAHNLFCYEQVCCTPFFYILMGIGSNLTHNQDRKSTY